MSSGAFEPVRVGVAGVGGFGLLHAMTLHGLAEAELVAVTHRRPKRLKEVANALPGVAQYTDLEQAIKESNAEAWVVASSTAAHVPMTQMILQAGKSVLLEKPIADNLAEAEQLRPLVADDSRNLMIGHILVFNSEFRTLVEEVQRRGPVSYLSSVRHRPTKALELFPGETPLTLLLVHDLYMTQVLMNRAEPTGFHCRFRQGKQVDLVLAELEWPDGAMARFAGSFLTPTGMGSDGFDRLEVFGKGWVSRIESNPRPITMWDDKANWPMALEIRSDPRAPSGMMAEELRCFCRVVRGMENVPTGATYHDAMQVQRWLDRLEHAATG